MDSLLTLLHDLKNKHLFVMAREIAKVTGTVITFLRGQKWYERFQY